MSKMDICIPYQHSPSNELEWAIKAARKNCMGLDEVYVVGDYPDTGSCLWLDVEPRQWQNKTVFHNKMAKILTACNTDAISDPFILMHDDMFFMERQQVHNYTNGAIQTNRKNSYAQMMTQTSNFLEKAEKQQLNYSLHRPMIIEKHRADVAIGAILNAPHLMDFQSIYGNYYSRSYGKRGNAKNPKNYKEYDILSTDEFSWCGEIGNYIRGQI